MEGIIEVYVYMESFITSYMEFVAFCILLCGFLKYPLTNRKIFLKIAVIPAIVNCFLCFFQLSTATQMVISNLAILACLEYLARISFVRIFIIYVLGYMWIMLTEVVQFPIWNLTSAGIFHGIAPIGGMIIVLLLAWFAYRYIPLHKVYEAISRWNILMLLVIINSFLVLFTVVMYARLKTEHFISNYLIIVGIMLILIVANVGEVYHYFKQKEQQKRMKVYEEYLPIIEGLIEQVRIRQHDYHNKLQSIHALAYVYKDFESLKGALLETTEHDMLPDFEMNLLKLNMHLVSGFLFSKIRQADKEGKELHLDTEQYVIRTTCTEYEVIECLGILIDNAIEATDEGGTILAKIGSQDDKLVFEIKNAGPHLTPEFCKNIFKKGYSTKKNDMDNHGIGLYKLNRMVKEHEGKLTLENVEVDQTEYISFGLII